jgi:hypothetical protein
MLAMAVPSMSPDVAVDQDRGRSIASKTLETTPLDGRLAFSRKAMRASHSGSSGVPIKAQIEPKHIRKRIPRMSSAPCRSPTEGAEIPARGLGTGGLGDDCGPAVTAALAGYRHIDTTRKYGHRTGA